MVTRWRCQWSRRSCPARAPPAPRLLSRRGHRHSEQTEGAEERAAVQHGRHPSRRCGCPGPITRVSLRLSCPWKGTRHNFREEEKHWHGATHDSGGTLTPDDLVTLARDYPNLDVSMFGQPEAADLITISVVASGNSAAGQLTVAARVVALHGTELLNLAIPASLPPYVAVTTDRTSYRRGDTLELSAHVAPGAAVGPVDVYVGLRRPDGTLLSLRRQGPGFELGTAAATPRIAEHPAEPELLEPGGDADVGAGRPRGRVRRLHRADAAGAVAAGAREMARDRHRHPDGRALSPRMFIEPAPSLGQ